MKTEPWVFPNIFAPGTGMFFPGVEARTWLAGHIEAHDFPEDPVTLKSMADAAGFHAAQTVIRHCHHHAMLFTMGA